MARTAKTEATAPKKPSTRRTKKSDPELRRQMIAEAAYFRAEKRGFVTGDTIQDWLEAEKEIERSL